MSGLVSAGLLLFRQIHGGLEVLIAHPGGPYYIRKNEGVWTVPKGLVEPDETPLDTARREFTEELGLAAPTGPYYELGFAELKSRKRVIAFAAEGDADPTTVHSNSFELEWPPRSGKTAVFPEIDRARFASPVEALKLLHPAQCVFVERLLDLLASRS